MDEKTGPSYGDLIILKGKYHLITLYQTANCTANIAFAAWLSFVCFFFGVSYYEMKSNLFSGVIQIMCVIEEFVLFSQVGCWLLNF